MPFFFYLARCSDGSLYAGVTDNLAAREARHNAGTGAKYTRGRGPVKMVYSEEFRTRSEALRREAAVKKLGKKQKEALIPLRNAAPTAFIFHGLLGSPEENWFPWMKKKLEGRGFRIIVPPFPCPDRPKLSSWMQYFKQYHPFIHEQTILIGHSLGATFTLRLLMALKKSVRATFLVAPVWHAKHNAWDPLMRSFTAAPYDWKRIRNNAGVLSVLYSDNDPYVSPEKSSLLASHLGVEPVLIEGVGHFNEAAGYRTFLMLLEWILSLPPAT
ncbi:MAG: alpha/beta fold hydrolase [Candidatus Peregrinibacteria bacterium]